MLADEVAYPNGQVLIATRNHFATLYADTVAKYPIATPQAFGGGKKVYAVPVEHLTWVNWVAPLF
jgi:hypothetical protein